MSKRVYKYQIPVDDQEYQLHLSGPIVHVGSQDAAIVTVWAEHNERPSAERTFQVYGTGHRIPDDQVYRGTALAPGGFVWHLYEVQA